MPPLRDGMPYPRIDGRQNPLEFRPHANWTASTLTSIYKQAESGGMLLTSMGCDQPFRIYWDHLVLNASQVTNPSIDPLREPMELRTYLGSKPESLSFSGQGDALTLETAMTPQLELAVPIMFSAMSYGSISSMPAKAWRVQRKSPAPITTPVKAGSILTCINMARTPSPRSHRGVSECISTT